MDKVIAILCKRFNHHPFTGDPRDYYEEIFYPEEMLVEDPLRETVSGWYKEESTGYYIYKDNPLRDGHFDRRFTYESMSGRFKSASSAGEQLRDEYIRQASEKLDKEILRNMNIFWPNEPSDEIWFTHTED